jgi:hypothetical protein
VGGEPSQEYSIYYFRANRQLTNSRRTLSLCLIWLFFLFSQPALVTNTWQPLRHLIRLLRKTNSSSFMLGIICFSIRIFSQTLLFAVQTGAVLSVTACSPLLWYPSLPHKLTRLKVGVKVKRKMPWLIVESLKKVLWLLISIVNPRKPFFFISIIIGH